MDSRGLQGGITMAEKFQVEIRNGDVLKGWSWPAENATANLTIMTGMNEYALRYDRVAKWFNEHGVNVWCLDAYGQGRNAASAELQERWPLGAYRNNVEALRAMVKKASGNGLPTFLMGHSMGSFMVQSFMERFHNCTSGIILCGSNGGQAALMRFGYRLARTLVHDWNWFETRSRTGRRIMTGSPTIRRTCRPISMIRGADTTTPAVSGKNSWADSPVCGAERRWRRSPGKKRCSLSRGRMTRSAAWDRDPSGSISAILRWDSPEWISGSTRACAMRSSMRPTEKRSTAIFWHLCRSVLTSFNKIQARGLCKLSKSTHQSLMI